MKKVICRIAGLCMALLWTVGLPVHGNGTAGANDVTLGELLTEAVADETTTEPAVCDTIFMTWTAEAGVEKSLLIEVTVPESWDGTGETFWVDFGDGTYLYSSALNDTSFTKTYAEAGSYNVAIMATEPEVRIFDFRCAGEWRGNNGVTSLDVSGCTDLWHLECSNNQLTSLDVIANTALTWLKCSNNQLSYLDVSGNPSLSVLYCNNNHLTSLDVSRNLTLRELECGDNPLTSLDVSANTALTSLGCNDNQLTSLDVSRNTALTRLYCYNNQLTSLDVSRNLTLRELGCCDNPLTSLDVSANTALRELLCDNNQLTSLDVSANTALTWLACYNNRLTSLDVSANTALTELYCENNQLTSLDVSANTALVALSCYNNQLTSLDVGANTALWNLQCRDNQLTSLDVSGCTALDHLYCYKNQLTSLDVSGCTALVRLECYNNQLTSLDVSTNTALGALYCYKNQLTSLDVRANTALTWLQCGNNQLTVDLDTVNSFDLSTLLGMDVSRIGSLSGGHMDGSRLIFETDRVTYQYATHFPGEASLGFDSVAFTLVASAPLTPTEPEEPTEPAVCDTIFMTWTAKTGWLNGFSFNGTAGKTFTVDWGDGSDTTVIGKGGMNFGLDYDHWLRHQYAEEGRYSVRVATTSQQGHITHFVCNNNGVTSLDVTQNPDLEELNCRDNQLLSLNVSANTVLKYLYCENNQLISLDVSANTALENLSCLDNQLTSLDVSANTALTGLFCWNNQLTSLDVSGCTALWVLNCDGNQLASLDVSANTDLRYLACSNNKLTSLNVSANTALRQLTCANNQLASLNLSTNTALELLYCSNNQLASLDVSANMALEGLYCYDNQLALLDVTHNLQLVELACQRNRLTGLDVSHNDSLTLLSCVGNRLASLDVTHNPYLRRLNCSKNQLREIWVSDTAFFHQVTCDSNLLPLSVLATLKVDTSAGNGACFSPQDIAVELETGRVLDLRGEMRFGNAATDYTVQKDGEPLSDTAFYTMTAGGINGRLRFKAPGFYRLRLSNAAVAETHSYDSVWYNGSGYEAPQPVYVYYNITVTGDPIVDPTDPTLPDTLVPENGAGWVWMASAGEEKEIEFKGTGKGFRVDWGDGSMSEAKGGAALDAAFAAAGPDGVDGAASVSTPAPKDSEKELKHRYAAEGIYTVQLIPLSQNGRLTDLDVSEERVLSLAFGDASMLETLDCSDNLLTALDLSGCAALQEADFSDNRLTSLSLPTHASLKDVEGEDNRLSLSTLYGLLSGRVKNASYEFDPQSDSVTVTENAVFDLASEMSIGGRATTFTLLDAATRRPVTSHDYAAEGGLFRFSKPGARYVLTLRNANVRDYEDGRADDMVAFTYYIYVSGVANEDLAADEAASASWAYVQGRTIYLTEPAGGAELGEVEAFTAVGQRVYRGHDHAFTVPTAGIYVLRAADGRRCKVMVR